MGEGCIGARAATNRATIQPEAIGVDADAVDVILTCLNGIGEHQAGGAAATAVISQHRTAIDVQRKLRRTGDGHRRTPCDSGGHHISSIQPIVLGTGGRRKGNGGDRGRRCRSSIHREGERGRCSGIAGSIGLPGGDGFTDAVPDRGALGCRDGVSKNAGGVGGNGSQDRAVVNDVYSPASLGHTNNIAITRSGRDVAIGSTDGGNHRCWRDCVEQEARCSSKAEIAGHIPGRGRHTDRAVP